MVSPNQIFPVICLTMEPRESWLTSVALLISSLRQNGGAHADIPVRIYVASGSSELKPLSALSTLNVSLLASQRNPKLPHLNKLAPLLDSALNMFSHALFLDSDILIGNLEQLNMWLDHKVRARKNYKYGLTKILGTHYANNLITSTSNRWRTISYYNAGVVFIPTETAPHLHDPWRDWTYRLLSPFNGHPLSEQVALAMTLAETNVAVGELPRHYNLTSWGEPIPSSAIIHYNSNGSLNKWIKREVLSDTKRFCDYLENTTSPFWRTFTPQFKSALGSPFSELHQWLVEEIAAVKE